MDGICCTKMEFKKCSNYKEVCNMYMQYISRTFKSAVIVFDGYDNPDSTTKSEQQRRYANISPQFSIMEVTPLSVGQEKF